MGTIEILLTSIALAMDAFAVSVCKGLSMSKMNWKKAITVGLYFGIFQALMPLIGYMLGQSFESLITNIDHWIAFVLLGAIGANMIKDSFGNESENANDKVDFKTMLPLAVATSIDALAVGITFAIIKADLAVSVTSIGVITFLLSMAGVKIGNVFGDRYEKKATFAGGTILILMGTKILLEHLGIL